MNDDLISRKEALEIIFKDGKWCCDIDNVYSRIENLGKAYDIDDVCKELYKMKQIMLSPANIDCFGEPCRESDCMACVLNKAIEIVRSGRIK